MAHKKNKKKRSEFWQVVVSQLKKRNLSSDDLAVIACTTGYAKDVESAYPVVAQGIGIARDYGNPIVYSWERKLYTMKPTPTELKMWLQSRLRFMDTVTSRSKGVLKMAKGIKKVALSKVGPTESRDFRRFASALEDMSAHFDDVSQKRKLAGTPATSRWRLRRERNEAKSKRKK